MSNAAQLETLEAHHMQAIALHLEGETVPVIAKRLAVSKSAVYWWRQSDVYRDELEVQREGLHSETMNLLSKRARCAARYLGTAVDPGSEAYEAINAHGVRAACAILDRVGLSAFSQRPAEKPGDDDESVESFDQMRKVLRSLPRKVILELLEGGLE